MVAIKPEWLVPEQENYLRRIYMDALQAIPPPGQGCHPALLRVANLGRIAGVEADCLFSDIRAAVPEGGRHVPDREILAAVNKAVDEVSPGDTRKVFRPRQPCRARVDGGKMRSAIISAGSSDEADLWEMSPVRLDDARSKDALLLLDTLYEDEDFLFLGDIYDKDVRTVAQWKSLVSKQHPPHIIPNPVDGLQHETSCGNQSFRCDAAVCQFRFAVAEFDDLSREDQLAFWSGVIHRGLLDVACLIDSGGKSIHAWLRMDCPDRASWEKQVENGLYARWLIPMGVDSACRNESRLSRLPGQWRAKCRRWQRLLYLNPAT